MDVEPLGRPRLFESDDKEYFPAVGAVTQASILAARANLKDPHKDVTFALAPVQKLSAPFLLSKEAA